MKFCTKCGAQCADEATSCPSCFTQFAQAGAQQNQYQGGAPYAAPIDPRDHTAEFDPRDISENKVICMLPYLLSVVGIILAALLANQSKYVAFHIRTALKYTVVQALLGICAGILAFTLIVPVAAAVCFVIVFVLQIITFFQVCSGKAKDPAIISSLGFLK